MSIDTVLYELSFVNLMLYCATLPSYNKDKGKTEKGEKVIKADDPNNKELLHDILNNSL